MPKHYRKPIQPIDEISYMDVQLTEGCSIDSDEEAIIELKAIVKELQAVRDYFGGKSDKCGQGIVYCAMDTIQKLVDVMEAEQ